MKSTARRHHTVPRFYLQHFSHGGQLGTVLLPGRRRFLQSVNDATVVKDFYSIGSPSNSESDAFERVLSQLESEASSVIRSALDGKWPLDPTERSVLAEFATVQFFRGPNSRQHLRDFQAQYARMEISIKGKDWMKDEFVRRGRRLDEEEVDRVWAEATREEGPPFNITAEQHIEQLVAMVPDFVWYFAARPWTLIRFKRQRLITSDTPLSLLPHADRDPGGGVGLANAWALSLPLSPTVGLLMTDPEPVMAHVSREEVAEGRLDGEEFPSTQLARMINSSTIHNARRFLYHHPDDESRVPHSLPEPVGAEVGLLGGDLVAMGKSIRALS